MYRIAYNLMICSFLLWIGGLFCYEENVFASEVSLRLYPNIRTIYVGSSIKQISITAEVRESNINLTYQWNLNGPGRLEGLPTEPAVLYLPPDRISGETAQATVTMTVKNALNQVETREVVLTLIPLPTPTLTPTPTPTPTPTATPGINWKPWVLGAGVAVAAIVGICCLPDDGSADTFMTDWDHQYPAEYSGPVWIEVKYKSGHQDIQHTYQIHWGLWLCDGQLPRGQVERIALLFAKNAEQGDTTNLHFHIEPACSVTFGQGQPSANVAIIDLTNSGCWHQ